MPVLIDRKDARVSNDQDNVPRVLNKYKNPSRGATYIGRGSPWGNPFVIGAHGTRDEVCDQFEAMVNADAALRQRIVSELKGRDLVCFCKPARCHGDFLLRLANAQE